MAGALKLLNANNISNRRGHLYNLLKAEHSEKETQKALADLDGYAEWGARKDLDGQAPGDAPAVPVSKKKK